MIFYNVTINIEASVLSEWLDWMKHEHIPEVLATGYFVSGRICRLLVEEESGVTYSIQYGCESLEKLKEYQEKCAPELQKKHNKKFEGKFVAFRSVMEEV
mgnify:CR=1 FL=1|jgi:hypothetical protein